jgi:hypothetical protein
MVVAEEVDNGAKRWASPLENLDNLFEIGVVV